MYFSREPAIAASARTTSGSAAAVPDEPLPENVEADNDTDSAFGSSSHPSYRHNLPLDLHLPRHHRKWSSLPTLTEGEYWGPVDEKQWESMEMTHLTNLVLDCQEENPYFRSPIGPNPRNILDIGSGKAHWAVEVADRYPAAVVTGADLYPPTDTWMPPNLVLEVDDILKPWQWKQAFDLVHLRFMLGCCKAEHWKDIYKQAFDSLAPGGWIEQLEPRVCFRSNDESLPQDSHLARWEKVFNKVADNWGHPVNILDTMEQSIKDVGFINVHTKDYKIPVGSWPKHPVYKEAGRLNLEQVDTGHEGYCTFTLSRWGEPEPWSMEPITKFCGEVREELRNKEVSFLYYLEACMGSKAV